MDNERSSREQNIVSQVLEQADELCVNSAFSMPLLMAEINLELGKVGLNFRYIFIIVVACSCWRTSFLLSIDCCQCSSVP